MARSKPRGKRTTSGRKPPAPASISSPAAAEASRQLEVLRRLRQPVAAELLGCTARHLRDVAPPKNPDGSYSARELVAWHVEREIAKLKPGDGVDPLMVGDPKSSPWLERYREQKVREAKRENDVAEGQLLDAAAVQRELLEASRILREEFEAIARVHGPEVGKALADGIARAQVRLGKITAGGKRGDGSDEPGVVGAPDAGAHGDRDGRVVQPAPASPPAA